MIRDRLAPLTESLSIPPADLLKLSNIQHLHTPIDGVLKREDGILGLVEALHPTPALGGDPQQDAMRLIRELEADPAWLVWRAGGLDRF